MGVLSKLAVTLIGAENLGRLLSSPSFQRAIVIANNKKYQRIGILTGAIAIVAWYYHAQKRAERRRKELQHTEEYKKRQEKKLRNRQFYEQLKELIPIVLPSRTSKEAFILYAHTIFLVARTFLSIYIAQLDGALVKELVARQGKAFLWSLCKWVLISIPASYINSMIKFLESKLALAFRTRLSEYAYDMYMQGDTYYRVGNLDSRLANADQCLTEDVARFSSFLAHLHSQLSKPILDVIIMTLELVRMNRNDANISSTGGSVGLATLVCYTVVTVTARVLKFFQPPFGKLAAREGELAGELRSVHSRLITNAEEIAFYQGHKVEHGILNRTYNALVKHLNYIYRERIFYNLLEGFFMKYLWSATGLVIVAIPVFLFERDMKNEAAAVDVVSERTQNYITAKKLMLTGAEAIERIMLALKEISELAGYTSRVHDMLTVFKDMKKGEYKKVMVNANPVAGATKQDFTKRGVTVEADYIEFNEVPIVSPNGDVLIPSMSFQAKPGMHLLITGPNGSGKSSLFRILGGLWPSFGGTVYRPGNHQMFYVPQRPYLPLGNLRDQIIYPDTKADMTRKGLTDRDLEDILQSVHLLYILEREGGWEAVNDWKDVLSGGEKQRVGFARVFYHKPKYAILDECTSAVSIDVEGKMYQHAKDLDITLLTVTHRPSLWKYHTHLLQFDGEGGYKFSELNASARLSLKEEKESIEGKLAGIGKMQTRLRELCNMLGEESVLLPSEEGDGKKPLNASRS